MTDTHRLPVPLQNPKINSTVMFGGYNPALPYYADPSSGMCYGFHYFSDTFVLDHSSSAPTWKQVLTPSFPTYRAQGQLLTDPATGKMFLFGGYTNTDWVPAGKHEATRSYGDIWQLVVDVPGGLYEDVNWDDEKRTALLGPWQVCYMCNDVGIHKKCKGACRSLLAPCKGCRRGVFAESRYGVQVRAGDTSFIARLTARGMVGRSTRRSMAAGGEGCGVLGLVQNIP